MVVVLTLPDNGGGDGQHEGQEPHQDGHLLGLGGGAQVLGLHWVNHSVVSEWGNSLIKLAHQLWTKPNKRMLL